MPLPIAVKRINLLAHNKNISVRQLQKNLNIHVGTVQSWNQSSPSVEALIPFAVSLNTSLDYLAGLTENPFILDDLSKLTESQLKLIMRIASENFTDNQVTTINEYLDETKQFSNARKKEVK